MSYWAAGITIGGSLLGGALSGDSTKETVTNHDLQIDESETTSRRLDISDEAIDKIVADILGAKSGIAAIFSEENIAGLYDSTVAAQASGDLVANLVGEIAKLRAVEVTDRDLTRRELGTKAVEGSTDSAFDAGGASGLLGSIGGLF